MPKKVTQWEEEGQAGRKEERRLMDRGRTEDSMDVHINVHIWKGVEMMRIMGQNLESKCENAAISLSPHHHPRARARKKAIYSRPLSIILGYSLRRRY